MNPTPPSDAELEALLRSSAPAELADAGFSVRVSAALPPRRNPLAFWRPVAVGLAAAVGLFIALRASPGGSRDSVEHTAALISQALSKRWVLDTLAIVASVWALIGFPEELRAGED